MTTLLARPFIVGLVVLGAGGCAATIGTGGPDPQARVWVCHGNRNPRWQRVAASAADAHRRHGDRVSTEPREEGAACEK